MRISSKVVRSLLLALAVTLSALAWGPSNASAACVNGSNRYVRIPGVCCVNTQKWKGQSCIFGVWTDNGATKCEGPCAV
ncbi:hypothetical protein EHM82_03220 [bacterium]|nr:MAG: hypothetical protein EHM82_03220 [bacterium]